MPKSVARKSVKKSVVKSVKRRSVPKKMKRKSTKKTSKKMRGRGYGSKKSSKSPKRKSTKSPKRKSTKKGKKMRGGSSLYSFDLKDNIGGLPAVVRSLNCRGQPGSNLNKN
jgi:hypothetical protein